MRTFRATEQSGYSDVVKALPGHRYAVKRPREVAVEFVATPQPIETREGIVTAHAGDAVVTGVEGERWPVPRRRFDARYRPVAPTRAGESGTYVSLRIEVLAVRLDERFCVELPEVPAVIDGYPGDWLVDYGDGSLGVIGADIFNATYELYDRV